MVLTSNQSWTGASVVIAFIGVFFLTKKAVRAKQSPSESRRSGADPSAKARGRSAAFAVGMLDIAIPRDDRPGGSFPRVMVNDACIARAVRGDGGASHSHELGLRPDSDVPAEVSRKLVVSLRDADDDSIPAGVVRAYVSRLYQEIYDAAIAADHPHLEFSVLVPPSVNNKRNQGQDHGDPPRPSSWASRDVAALSPDVEVLLSDDPRCEDLHAKVNAERFRVGLSPLRFVSLESVAERAHNPEYFYAEDVLPETPVFSNVACGGTFDRLHGGHKKLLTLAVSLCPRGTLTVGVTSDEMLKSKANAHLVTNVSERLKGVEDFVRSLNPQLKTRIEAITDPFGPPVAEEAFDAIAVSSETVAGAEKINELRAKKGFAPLAVAVTRRVAAATLSSSYLREVAEKSGKR